MTVQPDEYSIARRRLIVRDAVTFLSLILVTAVLFVITLFLFRSFAAHRQELAQRWSERGRAAISAGHPDQAIVALRTALAYAPDERSYELLLAQALGDAGHLEESYNYFLGLWDAEPGNGFINLRLARLAAKKNDAQAAINYYRAAIDGTWEGDGTVRRREVRIEMARYLMEHGDNGNARAELMIAGGNNPTDFEFSLVLAKLLQDADAPGDALNIYQKVVAKEPRNAAALAGAGRLEYAAGNYEEAYSLLKRAIREGHSSDPEKAERGEESISPDITKIEADAERIVALAPSRELPNAERVDRILGAREIAKKRLDGCNAQLSAASGLPSALQGLGLHWTGKEGAIGRAALLKDPGEQDAVVTLIFDTETQTSQVCGAPAGDDALLLLLARSPQTSPQRMER